MGQLLMLYASSDAAFIGGSLIQHGGQNPLEAAVLGLPIAAGQHMYNFAQITTTVNRCGSAATEFGSQHIITMPAPLAA